MEENIENVNKILQKYGLGSYSVTVNRREKKINVYCETQHSTFKYLEYDVVFHGNKEDNFQFSIPEIAEDVVELKEEFDFSIPELEDF